MLTENERNALVQDTVDKCARIAEDSDIVDILELIPDVMLKKGTNSFLLRFLIDIWPGLKDWVRAHIRTSSLLTRQVIAASVRKVGEGVERRFDA